MDVTAHPTAHTTNPATQFGRGARHVKQSGRDPERQLDPRREIVDAICYLVDTGCEWRRLPSPPRCSAQCAEERADVSDQQVRGLEGGEMASGVELRPVGDVVRQ